MRYRLTNKDVGPRYVFNTDGSAPIVAPGMTSDPQEISDVEIEAAEEMISPETGKAVWSIEKVDEEAEKAKADEAREALKRAEDAKGGVNTAGADQIPEGGVPIDKMNRDQLVAEIGRLRDEGKTVTVLDDEDNELELSDGKATKARMISAINAANAASAT